LISTAIISKHVEEVVVSLTRGSWALLPPGDRELSGRYSNCSLVSWRWKSDAWSFMSRHYFVSVHSTVNTV